MHINRQSRKALTALVGALALAAPPVWSGTLLVAVPDPQLADGTLRTVRLTFSNTGEVTRRATPTFIPFGADGTGSGRLVLPSISVPAKGTVTVDALAPDDGMLELVTAPQLVVSADLVLRAQDGTLLSEAHYPITDSDSLIPPDESSLVLDLVRGNGRVSDVAFVNPDGDGEAVCTVELTSSTGAPLQTLTRTVAPYSAITISDVLAGFAVSAARANLTCDRGWDGFAIVTDLALHGSRIEGRPALGTSTLAVPGTSSCPIGGLCLEIPGTVHTATGAAPNRTIELPVPVGRSFSRMRLEFDVVAGEWYAPRPQNYHGLFWIHRGSLATFDRNSFGTLDVRGTRNRLLLVTNVDLPAGDHTWDTVNAALTPGLKYQVVYEVESSSRRATFLISRDGNPVATMSTLIGGPISSGSQSTFSLYFGHPLNNGGIEVPWIGTVWSNLRFEATP